MDHRRAADRCRPITDRRGFQRVRKGVLCGPFLLVLGGLSANLQAQQPCTDCEAREPRVVVYLAGDTTGHGLPVVDSGDHDPLREVRGMLGDADVFIFNHEGALSDPANAAGHCAPFGRQSVFHSAPQFADHLALAPRNIAVLANNHILDCGPTGVGGTIEAFAQRGFATVGAGRNAASACAPQLYEVNGLRLAVLGYLAHSAARFAMPADAAGAATWKGCRGEGQVRSLAESTDLLIVSLHLHLARSWTEPAADEHIALAREVLAAGADIVFGHGPHVPQGVLLAEGGVALLSLGNFVFRPGYRTDDIASRAVVAGITVSGESIAIDLLPLRLDDSGWPAPAAPADAERITRELTGLSARLGTMMGSGTKGAHLSLPRRRSASINADQL